MTSIWNDPDLMPTTDQKQTPKSTFSLNDKLTVGQLIEMGNATWALHDRYNKSLSDSSAPVDWKEWKDFIRLSYDLGFVCSDGSDRLDDPDKTPIMDFIKKLEQDQNLVHALTLREIRQVIHYLVRSERWGDSGDKTGAGTLYSFVKSGLADAFARQMS